MINPSFKCYLARDHKHTDDLLDMSDQKQKTQQIDYSLFDLYKSSKKNS